MPKRSEPVLHYPLGRPLIRESLIRGDLPRSPRAPVGAFGPALNRPGCASPLSGVGPIPWRTCAKYGETLKSRERSCVSIPKTFGDGVLFAEGFRNEQFSS